MIGGFLRPDELGGNLVMGILGRKNDRQKLDYKAFLIGRQLGALERERAEFFREQAKGYEQMNNMLLMMMNLQAQQKQGQNIIPNSLLGSPSNGMAAASLPPQSPLPGASAGVPAPGGVMPGAEVPMPIPSGP